MSCERKGRGRGRGQDSISNMEICFEGERLAEGEEGRFRGQMGVGSFGREEGEAPPEWRRLSDLLALIYSEPGRSSGRHLDDDAI